MIDFNTLLEMNKVLKKRQTKIILVGGARPNFMKVAPVYFELLKHKNFKPILVHTGQHYDKRMSAFFFRDLGLPRPHIYLDVGSASHAVQTARIMARFEPVLMREKPVLVLVVGDVNSTVACALTAVKMGIKVGHVEAGLRSFDRSMPEEINRLLTDQISDFLFTTCEDANKNLLREGIAPNKIFFVGNTMIDSLLKHLEFARRLKVHERLGMIGVKFGLLTLHRPSNVDNLNSFQRLMDAVSRIAQVIPIIFPVHPRTKKQLSRLHFLNYNEKYKTGIKIIEPLGYLDFLSLMEKAAIVLTDSGGIQEETTILRIPCLTLRNNTERPITITQGTNILVGTDPKRIEEEALKIIKRGGDIKIKKRPKYWDGRAGERIVKVLIKNLK